jgi:hypothetical protein
LVIKMNTVGIFAGYFVDAFSVAFAPHMQARKRNASRQMPSLASRAQAESRPRRVPASKAASTADARPAA